MSAPLLLRKLHRWGSVLVALPLLVVFSSGIFLQLKKDVAWIQPPTRQGIASLPSISFAQILEAVRAIPECEIATWDDVDRLDVRPGDGILKVRPKRSRWEAQIDIHDGSVVQLAYRRSDLIEEIHDGSFFHPRVKTFVFLPMGIVLAGLWVTGLYLFFLPYVLKRRKRRSPAVKPAPRP